MAITVILDPPLETDNSATISSKAFQYVRDQATLADQINTAVVAMNFNATNSTSATSWTISDTGSQTFAIEAGKSYVIGMSVKVAYTTDGTQWGLGDVTAASSGSVTISFREKSGAGTYTAWTLSQDPGTRRDSVVRSARTSNTILSLGDRGKLIDVTSGTFTQTFDDAAVLGNGWYCLYKVSGDGEVTLDPSGVQTIDSLATFKMYPGEYRIISSDGSNLNSTVLTPFFLKITSSATFTKPPGYKLFGIRQWSGGASGQRTNSAVTISLGGGGGGCGETILDASSVGTTETVTIGAGGLPVTTVANGNPGGDTSFSALFTVYAGNTWDKGGSIVDGAVSAASAASEIAAYQATPATTSGLSGVYGGVSPSSDASTAGKSSIFGAGCGGSLSAAATVRAPGASTFGGDGGEALSASNGADGTAPGGGGGATQTGTQSGAGARGECWIWGMI